MRALAALMAGLIVLPVGAVAQESAGEGDAARRAIERAREHMERGQELYVQERYLESAEEFQRAFEAQPFGAFLFNAAISYERHREWSRAADFYARYLETDPSADDTENVRRRVDQLRTLALQEARASGTEAGTGTETGTGTGTETGTGTGTETGTGTGTETGTGTGTDPAPAQATITEADLGPPATATDMKSLLAVRTNPAGAQIRVRRGAEVVAEGPSPFAHTLEEGDYRLSVEHPDYRTVEETVRVRAGKVYVVIVEMSQGQFLGYLRVVTDIPGASVYIDDRNDGAVGQTPFQNVIATGEHRVWVERPGYRAEEQTVQVGLGEDVTVRLDLTRVDHGRIRVVANVRGAKVFIDDREVGEVPWEGDVANGPRRVRVEAEDMKDYETTIDVRQGQVTPLRVRLRPAVGRGGAWVTAALAGLLVAGGAVMGVLSSGIEEDLTNERDGGRLASDDPRLFEGQLLAIGADVAFGFAVLLGGLSIYYFLRDPLPDSEGTTLEPRDWALAPYLSPDGGGAGARWSF